MASTVDRSSSGASRYGYLSFPWDDTSTPQSISTREIGVCKRKQLRPTCLAPPSAVNLTHSSIFSGFHSL